MPDGTVAPYWELFLLVYLIHRYMKSRFTEAELLRRWSAYCGGAEAGKPAAVSPAFKEQTRDGLNLPTVRQWC